jgi:TonB family protein
MQDSPSRKTQSDSLATERRAEPRYPVRPVEYTEVGENNGGIILDMSESGMAISTAQALVGNPTLRFRFQLPRFLDAIETLAEISWIGEKRKRAGVRFIDLPQEAHEQIQRWIRLQASNETQSEEAPVDETEESVFDEMSGCSDGLHLATDQSTTSFLDRDSFLTPAEEPGRDDEAYPEHFSQPGSGHQPEIKKPPPDRRTQVRRPMNASTYLQLNDGNAGLIADLSETGLSFRAAKVLESDHVLVRFQVPGSDRVIETPALIVWKSASKKKVGARFAALPEAARNQIAEWIGSPAVTEPPATIEAAELSASDAVNSATDLESGPDSVPIPPYIYPRTGQPAPAPDAPLNVAPLVAAATSKRVSPEELFSSEKPTAPSPFVMKPGAPSPVDGAPLRTPPPLPSFETFLEPARDPLPDTSPAKIPAAALAGPATSNAKAFPKLDKLDPEDPLVYWAPKRLSNFWKISAGMVLLGGVCFGAGFLFSRNRQLFVASIPSATRSSVSTTPAPSTAASGVRPSDSDPAAENGSIAKPPVVPTAPSPNATERPTNAARNSLQNTEDQEFSRRAHINQFPDPASTNISPRAQNNSPIAGSNPAQSANPVASPQANAASPNDSRSAAVAANLLNTVKKTAAVAEKPVPSTSTSSLAPGTKPTATSPSPQKTLASPAAATPNVSQPPATSEQINTNAGSVAAPSPVQELVGSVSFFSRFRSIRNSGDSANPSSGSGGVLQIGPLLSSPLPAYPADAQHKQIQGLVELDVMVAADGSVQSVRFVSGPAELSDVAMNAVRGWHYGSTVLGGHPVAVEQSVFFTFKLSKPNP